MTSEQIYLESILKHFKFYKQLAEDGLAQVSGDNFFEEIGGESDSVAIVVKHMGGNLRSRWRNFLTSDGEKEDRNRDSEFLIDAEATRESIMTGWEDGWGIALGSISSLTANDLKKNITIRSEPMSVIEALNRALTHAAYHCGQIVLLAKQFSDGYWQSLSIPRGESKSHNAGKGYKLDA